MSGIIGGIGAGSRSGVLGKLLTGPQIGSGTTNPGSTAGYGGPFLELRGAGPTLSLHDSGTGSPMWEIAGYNQDLRISDDGIERLYINSTGDIYSTAWTSWTPTVVGFSGTPTVLLGKYKRIGKLVYVMFFVEGTSDAETLYVTNMPVAPYATGDYHQALAVGFCQDNSANTGLGTANILTGNGYCYCRKGGAYDGWTASGTKNILVSGVYEANAI